MAFDPFHMARVCRHGPWQRRIVWSKENPLPMASYVVGIPDGSHPVTFFSILWGFHIWLVVWNMTYMTFHIGVQTTNQ
jgi:hypothetical protein